MEAHGGFSSPRGESALLQGYLRKRSNKRIRNWHRRWFVVKRGTLLQFNSREAYYLHSPPRAVTPLTVVKRVVDMSEKPTLGFELWERGEKRHYLLAESPQEKQQWMDVLGKEISTERRVTIFRNGSAEGGKVILLPEGKRGDWGEFLRRCGVKLGMNAIRAFSAEGTELESVEKITGGDVLFISTGDGFAAPPSADVDHMAVFNEMMKTVTDEYFLSPRRGGNVTDLSTSGGEDTQDSARREEGTQDKIYEEMMRSVQQGYSLSPRLQTPYSSLTLGGLSSESEGEAVVENERVGLRRVHSAGPSLPMLNLARVSGRREPVRPAHESEDESHGSGRSSTSASDDSPEKMPPKGREGSPRVPPPTLSPIRELATPLTASSSTRSSRRRVDAGNEADTEDLAQFDSELDSSEKPKSRTVTMFVPPIQLRLVNSSLEEANRDAQFIRQKRDPSRRRGSSGVRTSPKDSPKSAERHRDSPKLPSEREDVEEGWITEREETCKKEWMQIAAEDFGRTWEKLGVKPKDKMFLKLVDKGLYLRFEHEITPRV